MPKRATYEPSRSGFPIRIGQCYELGAIFVLGENRSGGPASVAS
jgi:hypothetical protein